MLFASASPRPGQGYMQRRGRQRRRISGALESCGSARARQCSSSRCCANPSTSEKQVTVEARFGMGMGVLEAQAASLLANKVDLIVAQGTQRHWPLNARRRRSQSCMQLQEIPSRWDWPRRYRVLRGKLDWCLHIDQ